MKQPAVNARIMASLPPSYDSRTILLHWITAGIVVALWCLGETIDWFPKGNARIAARGTHICLGATLAIVLCVRVWWRIGGGSRLPAVGTGIMRVLSTVMQYALYALMAGTVVLGVTNAWVRGDNLFNLFVIPAFDPGNKPLRAQVGDLHALFANVLIALAGLHAAAGLAHHFIWKDEVLRRMLPRRRSG